MGLGENVALLGRLLDKAAAALEEEGSLQYDLTPLRTSEELRQRLAAQIIADGGVLVPGALTDDEAVKIGADASGTTATDRSEIAHCVREGLERAARSD
jgi:hypothetical protein